MRLYDGACRVSSNMKVHASDGSEHPLLTVIGTALTLIRADAVAKLIKAGYKEADIHWIITVPAMAKDEQLAFMRRAAVEAGMVPTPDNERLTLVSEPEAACAHMITQPMMAKVRVGETIAVLDCGGGTHDFVALRLLSRDPFRVEFVSESEGGAGGAADVNEAFYREMSRLVSKGESDTALQTAPDVIANLWKIAEQAKQQLNEEPDKAMLFDLGILADFEYVTRADFGACVNAFNARLGYTAIEKPRRGMCVRFAARFFRELVLNAAHPVERLAHRFLARTHSDYVIVVGGFAESKLLCERLQAAAGAVRVLVPSNPSTCVARGGIALMGAQVSRVCRFTYGIRVRELWSKRFEGIRGAKKKVFDGEPRCKNAFHRIIARGQVIRPGWRSEELVFPPALETQNTITLCVFRSEEEDPLLVAGQKRLGRLVVTIDEETLKLPCEERLFGISWTWKKEIVLVVTRKRDGYQWRIHVDVE